MHFQCTRCVLHMRVHDQVLPEYVCVRVYCFWLGVRGNSWRLWARNFLESTLVPWKLCRRKILSLSLSLITLHTLFPPTSDRGRRARRSGWLITITRASSGSSFSPAKRIYHRKIRVHAGEEREWKCELVILRYIASNSLVRQGLE